MNGKITTMMVAAVAAMAACAQQKDNFLRQQAFAEMQRVTGQIDVLESNQNDLAQRISRVEMQKREIDALRAEIASLRATVESLKHQVGNVRGEVVRELTGEIKKLKPVAPPPPPRSAYQGPMKEYTVAPGDTLSIIAEAFGTNVRKIREMNNLKSDVLRVGQRIKVPGK